MSRGHDRERAVRAVMQEDGWLAFRAPASLGVADVVALKAGERPRLIEVKSTQGPYRHFLPRDRAELLAAALQAGADAFLAYWPSRGKLEWIEASEWP
jgi:Holliday junction resolvase